MKLRTSVVRWSIHSTLLATVLPVSLMAQELLLEEVIVTAQKRTQSLQNVPIAISAMSGEKIVDTGIISLEEIALYMPNVTINNGAESPARFIRGVGSGSNSGFEQSVGLYVDGVYGGRGAHSVFPMTLDLERVEILKGPQGILFGKNSVAGAINVTTAKPSDEFEGMIEGLWEPDHGEEMYSIVLSGPLTDQLSGRVAVRYDALDGWWDNVTLDEEGPDRENWFARGSLRWQSSQDLEFLLKYEYGDFSQLGRPTVVYQSDFVGQENFAGTVPFPVVSDRSKGVSDADAGVEIRSDLLALTINWQLESATLTSITAWTEHEWDQVQNSDQAATPSINRSIYEDFEQISQEVRLVSPGEETIDWIAGFYYQSTQLDLSRINDEIDFLLSGPLGVEAALLQTTEPVPSIFDQESESWALFAQGTWNASDALRLTLGLRYSEESKDLDKVTVQDRAAARAGPLILFANPLDGNKLISDLRSHSFTDLSRDEDKWTWSAIAQWDASEYTMLYASISTGFKGGGYDEAYSSEGEFIRTGNPFTGEPSGEIVPGVDASVIEYEDEEVLAYELGAKMSLAGGAAELNLALFRMEYENLQTSSLVGDVFRVGNAGEAISQGMEVDGRWRVAPYLTLGGSIAYLDATYDEFLGATCTIPQANDPANNPGCLRQDGSNIEQALEPGGQDLGGETLLYSPEWSANLNAQLTLPISEQLGLITTVDINYIDEFYSALDLDPATPHDSKTLVSARIALAEKSGRWSLALIGKNLTDETTYIWKNDVPLTNSNSYFALPNRPRSIALQARYRF